MRHYLIHFFLIFCVISLLFFPQTSVEGAKNGLILWSGTIIPTLLPFLLLTGFMQYYQTFHFLSYLFFPLKKLFPNFNMDFFYTCILGFLCGCPLGAKIINDLVIRGSYTKEEGQKLLYLCNQISPMFTIGYTFNLILHEKISLSRFLFCLYFPAFLYLFYLFFLFSTSDFLHIHHISSITSQKKSIDRVIFDSLSSIFMIGICIMVFSIASSMLVVLPLPLSLKNLCIGMLEITNAISHFGTTSHFSFHQKSVFLCMITSFSGCCAIMQTMSVCKKSRLSIWKYLLVKLLFSMFSGFLALLLLC